MRKTALLAAVLGVCAPAAAFAQTSALSVTEPPPQAPHGMWVGGGMVSAGDYSYQAPGGTEISAELESGFSFSGGYSLALGEQLRLDIGGAFRSQSGGETEIGNTPTPQEPEMTVFSLDAGVIYSFVRSGRLRPYVRGSAGLGYADVRDAVLNDSGEAVKLRGVAGLNAMVSDKSAFFIEGGYEYIGIVIETTNGFSDEIDDLSLATPVVSIGFRVGL